MLPKDTKYTISWLPFLLSPKTPPEGINRFKYLGEHYGMTEEDCIDHDKYLQEKGAPLGIKFNISSVVSNTIPAHRLAEYAKTVGKGHEAVMVIFKKYFDEAKDVGKVEVLDEIVKELGITLV